jgi:hypothetical protein
MNKSYKQCIIETSTWISEPASMLLVGVGLIGHGLFSRKNVKKIVARDLPLIT